MTDTLVAMTVLGRRYFQHIQKVGIAVDGNYSIPITHNGKEHPQPLHFSLHSCNKILKWLTVKIKAPIIPEIFLIMDCDDHLFCFFARHYVTPQQLSQRRRASGVPLGKTSAGKVQKRINALPVKVDISCLFQKKRKFVSRNQMLTVHKPV